MGRGHLRAIGTLVERTTRYVVLLNLVSGFSADRLNELMRNEFDAMPEHLRRTLTWDQGTEMSGHMAFTAATGIPVYLCQARSPWERGPNENANGLLRQYFPKGVDLSGVTTARLKAVARQLNDRPRRILKWATPADRSARVGAMTGRSPLRIARFLIQLIADTCRRNRRKQCPGMDAESTCEPCGGRSGWPEGLSERRHQ
jgi:transposase, IS30 family